MMQSNQRLSDIGSYVTETSSVTIPAELDLNSSSGYDVDDDDLSFFDSVTSALTGWTEKFQTSASKNSKSVHSEGSGFTSEHISAITFDNEHGSVVASLYDIDDEYSRKQHREERETLAVIPTGKGAKYSSPSYSSPKKQDAEVLKEDTDCQTVSSSSSVKSTASNSSKSKKRAPVPPLRDPNMEDKEEDQMWEEDCNYDINPSLVFLVLESRNWEEAIALLDGKGLENKNGLLNLGQLFAGYRTGHAISDELAKKRQKELRSQARTWIVRRERTGVLRWRMLPLHAALAFNAPFDVVLRLYHLYPGAIRCRNDQGMLPLHHCFKYGNEDKILEFLLDVFPEALTVMDDKGRLPLGCTPKDGSENERRTKILVLFANFQVEMAKKVGVTTGTADAATEAFAGTAAVVPQSRPPLRSQEEDSTLIGAVPRYTSDTDYNQVIFSSIKPTSKNDQKDATYPKMKQGGDDEVDGTLDRYAMLNFEDGENVCLNRKDMVKGLMTIPENDTLSPMARSNLKSELLELSEKNKRKGLKKIFRRKKVLV
jgi:hypothetical protein